MPSPFSGTSERGCKLPALTSRCTAINLFCAITVCTAPCTTCDTLNCHLILI